MVINVSSTFFSHVGFATEGNVINLSDNFIKILVLWVIGAMFTGCRDGGAPGEIHFSPDGNVIAYTYVERIDLPLPPEMPTLRSTVYLKWCETSQISKCNTLKIDTFDKSYGSFVQNQFRLKFSPNSKYIALKSPRILEIIDLGSFRRQKLTGPDELVTSMAWRGNTELIYVTHTETDRSQQGFGRIRKMYRQNVKAPRENKFLLFEQHDYRGISHDFVSPAGDFILFMSQGYSDGLFSCLDVKTGEITTVNNIKAQCQGASWKTDGSCVFCLSSSEALLYFPNERRTEDLSDDYNNSFRRSIEYSPTIDELWTPDGEYIVLNSPKTGGCLIRPYPWFIHPIGKELVRYLEEVEQQHVYRNPSDSYPYLFVQPCSGWVRLWINIISEEKPYLPGQSFVLKAKNYLVDYEGRRFVSMKPSDSPGGAWLLTPDGQKLIYFEQSNILKEEPIHLSGFSSSSDQ